MFKKLSDFAYKKTKVSGILLFLGLFLILNLMIFPLFINQIGLDKKILDLSFGFSPEVAYSTLLSYGEQGRFIYSIMLLTADTVYPLVYSIFLVMGVSMNFKKAFKSTNPILKLNIFPLLAGLFDFCENTGILIMLYNFPEKHHYLAWFASVSGMLKWTVIIVSLLLIITSIGVIAVKKIKERKQAK